MKLRVRKTLESANSADEQTRLGEHLVALGSLSKDQLETALTGLTESGLRLGDALLAQGTVEEHELAEGLALRLGYEIVRLRDRSPDAGVSSEFDESTARRLNVVPLARVNGTLEVAASDPSPETVAKLKKVAGKNVVIRIAGKSEIETTIQQLYRTMGRIDEHVQRFVQSESIVVVSSVTDDVNAEVAPVVEVVNLIMKHAQRDRVSDVHIEPQGDALRVRFRVDGALHDVQSLPSSMAQALVSRIKIMAGMNIVERRRPQDGQFAIDIDGHALDVRVATTATVWGEKAVLRLLDKSRPLFRLGELGMPAETHELFSKMVRSPFGMVICAGPTGSGKTTTLYGTLNEINDPERNIMTIEDPVEYIFPSINQIQMNEQAGLSFADGLKSMLRQDPDVILVGEVRDVETARIAVQSALTGHFVLSSLHATDSAAALHRFLDMGVESFLISSSVLGIVAQRLVRRICTSCTEIYEPTDEELAFYEEAGGEKKTDFWHGAGCNLCGGTGFKGRIGVYELLRVTPELKRLIVGWATQDEIRRMAMKQGMRTLRQEGAALVSKDVTTVSEVIRNVYAI